MEELELIDGTMDSREIARVTGKRHADVCRDIRNMLRTLQLGERRFASSYVSEQNKDCLCYRLPKRECLGLAIGYDVELRFRLIDRWAELESQVTSCKPLLPDFNNPVAAARAWADATEQAQIAQQQVAQLEHRVTEDLPKVQAFDAYMDEGVNVSLTRAAKLIGVRPHELIDWMEHKRYIYRDADWKHVPDQHQINCGRLVLKVVLKGRGYNQTMVTPKGVAWLNKLCSEG